MIGLPVSERRVVTHDIWASAGARDVADKRDLYGARVIAGWGAGGGGRGICPSCGTCGTGRGDALIDLRVPGRRVLAAAALRHGDEGGEGPG